MPGADWDDASDARPPKERHGRSHAARRREAQALVEQLAWCEWPIVYWAGSPGSPAGSDLADDSVAEHDAARDAHALLAARLKMRPPGAYVVQLTGPIPAPVGRETTLRDLLLSTNPIVARLELVSESLIADAWNRILKARRLPKSIPKIVGDMAAWEGAKEAQIQRARLVLNAVRSFGKPDEKHEVPADALVLESLCIWIGPDDFRPSARLGAGALAIGRAAHPPAWDEAAAARLGQLHVPRPPPREVIGWYRAGRALASWPLDLVMQTGRALGNVRHLADRAEASPALNDPAAALLVRDMVLAGVCGDELAQRLVDLPALLSGWDRLHAVPREAARWRLPFLLAGARSLPAGADSAAALAAWTAACREESATDTRNSDQPIRVALLGLLGVGALTASKPAIRQAAWLILAGTARAFLAELPKEDEAATKDAVDWVTLHRGVEVLCAAAGHGLDAAAVELIFEHGAIPDAHWILHDPTSDPAGIVPLVDWMRNSGTQKDAEAHRQWRLGAPNHQTWTRLFGLLEPSVLRRFITAAAARPPSQDQQEGQLYWLFEFLQPSRDPSAAGGAGARRAAFLRRHVELLLTTSMEASRVAESKKLVWERLRHWRQCVDIGVAWEETGLGDCERLVSRLLAEYARRPGIEPYMYFAAGLLRTLLRLSNGNADRAAVLAYAKIDIAAQDVTQVASAWDLLEASPELREFLSRLTGNDRMVSRVVRWLARLGFCLRLQRAARLSAKIASMNLFGNGITSRASLSPVLRGEGRGEGSDDVLCEPRISSTDPSPQPSPLSAGEREQERTRKEQREPNGSAAGRSSGTSEIGTRSPASRGEGEKPDAGRSQETPEAGPDPSASRDGTAGLPSPVRSAVPSECANDFELLLRLLPDSHLPHRISEILDRPGKLAQEREMLESRERLAPLPAHIARRLRNLRNYLDNSAELERWITRDLKSALRDSLDEARMAALERLTREITDGHVRKLVGAPPPAGGDGRDWDNAVRLYFSVERNRKILKRLLRHEARGDRGWLREHPPNRAFIDRMTAAGVNMDVWLGEFDRVVETPGGTWVLSLETLPLRVLQMGNYFDTCLGVGGANAFSTIANACEANKRVIYVRDERGVVIGRKLLALTDEKWIAGFHSYGVGPLDAFYNDSAVSSPWMKIHLDLFCRELADRCRASLHPWPDDGPAAEPTFLKGLFAHWYNDGIEPYDRAWLRHDGQGLRRHVRETKTPPDLLSELSDGQTGTGDAAGRVLAWLGDDGINLLRAFLLQNDGKPKLSDQTGLQLLLRLLSRHAAGSEMRAIAREQLAARFGHAE